MARYGKLGSDPTFPGPFSYEPNMGKSPSMNAKSSSNVLPTDRAHSSTKGRRYVPKMPYDARGTTLFQVKKKGLNRGKKSTSEGSLRLQDQEWFKAGSAPNLKIVAHHTMSLTIAKLGWSRQIWHGHWRILRG